MADLVFPNPIVALPRVNPTRTFIESAGRGILNAAKEVSDAHRSKVETRQELLDVADLLESDDPDMAEVLRRQADSVDAYAPLSGDAVSARAASRATGAIRGGLISELIKHAQRKQLINLDFKHTLAAADQRLQNSKALATFKFSLDQQFADYNRDVENKRDDFEFERDQQVKARAAVVNARQLGLVSQEEAGQILSSTQDAGSMFGFLASRMQSVGDVSVQEALGEQERELDFQKKRSQQLIDTLRENPEIASLSSGQVTRARTEGVPLPRRTVTEREILDDETGEVRTLRTEETTGPVQSTEIPFQSDILRNLKKIQENVRTK